MANEIYNTSWWGTALDTARTAGTNPDFFGSQFKLLTSEQDDLVVNGDFATDSDWTKIGNATIQNGYAELTFDGTTGNQIRQTTLTSGKIYKVQYEILSNTGTDGQVFMNAFSNGTAIDISVGTYTLYLTAINTTFFNFRTLGGTGGSVQIDNVSIQLVRCDLDQIEAKKCLADWIHRTALQDLNN